MQPLLQSRFRPYLLPQKLPLAHLQSIPTPPPSPRKEVICFAFWDFDISGIIEYVVFCVFVLVALTTQEPVLSVKLAAGGP